MSQTSTPQGVSIGVSAEQLTTAVTMVFQHDPEIQTLLKNKQDTIPDLETLRENAALAASMKEDFDDLLDKILDDNE